MMRKISWRKALKRDLLLTHSSTESAHLQCFTEDLMHSNLQTAMDGVHLMNDATALSISVVVDKSELES